MSLPSYSSAPAIGTPRLLSTTNGINGQTLADTALFVVPAGKTLVLTSAVIRCTLATAITVGPSLGIGNVAGTNNIFASATISGLIAVTINFGFVLFGLSVLSSAGATIYLNLSVAAIGTAQTICCDLFGYLV